MAISALNLNNNAMCELGAMFYFETMSAPFAHRPRFRIRDARWARYSRWLATRTLTLIDLLSPISRRNTQRRAARREIFFSKASTIERRSRTFG
jgi:hypothetical protein